MRLHKIPCVSIDDRVLVHHKSLDAETLFTDVLYGKTEHFHNYLLFHYHELPLELIGATTLGCIYYYYLGSYSCDYTIFNHDTRNITHAVEYLALFYNGPILERLQYLETQIRSFPDDILKSFDKYKREDPRCAKIYELVYDETLKKLIKEDLGKKDSVIEKSRNYFQNNLPFEYLTEDVCSQLLKKYISQMDDYNERLHLCNSLPGIKELLIECNERFVDKKHCRISKPLPPPLGLQLINTDKGCRVHVTYNNKEVLLAGFNQDPIATYVHRKGWSSHKSDVEVAGWSYDQDTFELHIPGYIIT